MPLIGYSFGARLGGAAVQVRFMPRVVSRGDHDRLTENPHEWKRVMTQTRFVATAAVATCLLLVASCGGGGGGGPGPGSVLDRPPTDTKPPPDPPSPSAAEFLDTPRFITHQPLVLEQIGAHHAYARGLTGKGIRIGIDDSIVDYTQSAEFDGRVALTAADGADLAYNRPDGNEYFSDVDNCRLAGTCTIWEGDSGGDPEAVNNWVRRIVDDDGWPLRDDSVFIRDDHYSEFDTLERLFRWKEVPTPYGEGAHGTIVASVAAGKNLGVAPAATIIPIAQNLTDDQRTDALADAAVRQAIALLSPADRTQMDQQLASDLRNEYAKFDIINRSYGTAIFDPQEVSSAVDSELRWYRRNMPRYLDALLQVDRAADEKTIVVYAAGNEGEPWSNLGADLPYHIPELRGHSLAVAATDPKTGAIATYSNRCGRLPSDWNAARYGPHYCLAAPGTVRGLVPNENSPGQGDIEGEIHGTSVAAPMVSGALALMMEHFRGMRGNSQIVKRMLDTADRSGRYADLEVYGAGHLDLEAALAPVGALSVGQSAQAIHSTTLQTPVAFGSVASRAASLEVAAFDQQDFPFWVPISTLISSRPNSRSRIPEIDATSAEPATGLDVLGLRWTPLANPRKSGLAADQNWVTGFNPTSASLAHQPLDGGWGYGLSVDADSYLGARSSGAFGSDLSSGMIWTSHNLSQDLPNGWTLEAAGTLALSIPAYERDAIFQASPSVLSAFSMQVGTPETQLAVEQPLRAETGTGTFRVENGWIENGRRLHDEHRVSLSPDAREMRMTLRHEADAAGGRIALEVGGALNADHIPGESEANVGLAWRFLW